MKRTWPNRKGGLSPRESNTGMHELYNALREYRPGYRLRMMENRIILTTPYFLPGYDESIALYVEKTGDDRYTICDCHSITDYWEIHGFDPFSFLEKIAHIMDRYGLTFDENCFFCKVYAPKRENLYSALDCFMQALSVLANMDFS